MHRTTLWELISRTFCAWIIFAFIALMLGGFLDAIFALNLRNVDYDMLITIAFVAALAFAYYASEVADY